MKDVWRSFVTLNSCQLEDVGFLGKWFKWERGNLSETNIKEHLDRGVANSEWLDLFPNYTIHLTHSFSGHCLLVFQTKQKELRKRMKGFRFEALWEEVKRLRETSIGGVVEKLEYIRKGLQRWSWKIKRSLKGLLMKLLTRIAKSNELERMEGNLEELIDTKIHLNMKINKEEKYWEQ
ncbi:reverse transcriptase [Gossypium australe]|uniref:Reverse transcriptase n=1 Tax=Gossypium australe TaxID=47621 RepID=A0A5B6W7N8_9ROSI|nr:reverse transcriptase [Gossypium australe]